MMVVVMGFLHFRKFFSRDFFLSRINLCFGPGKYFVCLYAVIAVLYKFLIFHHAVYIIIYPWLIHIHGTATHIAKQLGLRKFTQVFLFYFNMIGFNQLVNNQGPF